MNKNNNMDNSSNGPEKRVELEKKQLFMEFERTYNAWMTASIGALIGGLYVAEFLGIKENSIITTYFGIALVLGGIGFSIAGILDYRAKLNKYENQRHESGISVKLIVMASSFYIIIGIIALILIIQLNSV